MLTMNDGANSMRSVDSNGNTTEVRTANLSAASPSTSTTKKAFAFVARRKHPTTATKKNNNSPVKNYDSGFFSIGLFASGAASQTNAPSQDIDNDAIMEDKETPRTRIPPFATPTAIFPNVNGNGNSIADIDATTNANNPHLPALSATALRRTNRTAGKSAPEPSVIVLEDSEEEELGDGEEEMDKINVLKTQPPISTPPAVTATHIDQHPSLPTQPLQVDFEGSNNNIMRPNVYVDDDDQPVEVPLSQLPRDSRDSNDGASGTSAISVPDVCTETNEYKPVSPPGPRNAKGSLLLTSRNPSKRRRIIKTSDKPPEKERAPLETIDLDPSDDVEVMTDERNSPHAPASPSRTAQVEVSQTGQARSMLQSIIPINGGNEQGDMAMLDEDAPNELGENVAQNLETDADNVNNTLNDNDNRILAGMDVNMNRNIADFSDWNTAGNVNVNLEPAVTSDSEQPQRELSEVLFRFPPVGRGRITVRYEDYDRLYKREYLNDSLIDFYIKYIEIEQANMSTPKDVQPPGKPYFFSSFFYSKLRPNTALPWSQIDYNGVKRWTASVDLFSKELIFMPICDSAHWSLIIIVNLNEMEACLHDEARFESLDNNKKPRILYFDSLEPKRGPVFGKMVVHYLAAEFYERKILDEQDPDGAKTVYQKMTENIHIDWPYVPRQINEVDCGLYLLHNISCFLDESTKLRKLCLKGPRHVRGTKRQVQIKQFYSHTEVHNLRQYILLLIMELEKGGITNNGVVEDKEVLAENHPAIFPPKELPPSVPLPPSTSPRLNGRVEAAVGEEKDDRYSTAISDSNGVGEGTSLAALAAASINMTAGVATAELSDGGVDVDNENMERVDAFDVREENVEQIDDDVKIVHTRRSTGQGSRSKSTSMSPPREIQTGSFYASGSGSRIVPISHRLRPRTEGAEHGRNTCSQPTTMEYGRPRRSTRSSAGINSRSDGNSNTAPGRQTAPMPVPQRSFHSNTQHDVERMIIDHDPVSDKIPAVNDAIMQDPDVDNGNGNDDEHTGTNKACVVIDLDD